MVTEQLCSGCDARPGEAHQPWCVVAGGPMRTLHGAAAATAAQQGSWDPLPHLAQLIDGLTAMARRPGNINKMMGELLAGPYAALRGGLLLDEAGREHMTTTAALAEVLNRDIRWAPYQEFGIPDPAAESVEAPAGPVIIGATGYRGGDIIVYWSRP